MISSSLCKFCSTRVFTISPVIKFIYIYETGTIFTIVVSATSKQIYQITRMTQVKKWKKHTKYLFVYVAEKYRRNPNQNQIGGLSMAWKPTEFPCEWLNTCFAFQFDIDRWNKKPENGCNAVVYATYFHSVHSTLFNC